MSNIENSRKSPPSRIRSRFPRVGAHDSGYRPSAARLLRRGDAMQASLPQKAVGDRHPLYMRPMAGC